MIVLLVLAALAPIATALGVVLWRRYIGGEETAGGLIGGVVAGLLAGVLLGGAVGGLVLLLAFTIVRMWRG